jgi:threonine dehydratase
VSDQHVSEQSDSAVNRDAVREAAARISPYIRRTPILAIEGDDIGVPLGSIVFKLEFMQHGGSFKPRGAFTNMLTRPVPAAGVVAASGGNHGVAVAYAAHKLGIPATIFVPSVAAPEKLARIQNYGANLRIVGERYADSLAASEDWARQSGALPVHAYDSPETITGQATLALELEQQSPGLDALLIAVGGGGLIAGVASWYRDSLSLVGVEPEGAPTLSRALAAGKPVDSPAEGIAADSLAPRRVGEFVFPIAQRHVREVLLVTDDQIVRAQQQLWDSFRIVTEPGGAAAFAGLLSHTNKFSSARKVGVVLCGANTGAVKFRRPGVPA